MTNKVRRRC